MILSQDFPSSQGTNPCSNTGLDSQTRKMAGVGQPELAGGAVATRGFGRHPESVSPAEATTGSGPSAPVSARPDWLQCTFASADLDKIHELLGVLERTCGEQFDLKLSEPVVRGIRWDGHARSPSSVQVAYRQVDDLGFQFWLCLPGTVWGSVEKRKMESLCCYLHHQRDFCVTRLDLALDDFSRSLSLDAVESAVRSGAFAGAKTYQLVTSGERGTAVPGKSVIVGSSQSDKRVTFYDKSVESKGKINSIRVEVRLRGELAQKAWSQLLPKLFDPGLVADFIVGSVSFLERKGKNLCRGKLLGWWTRFLEFVKASPKKLFRTPRLRTLEKAASWLRRQVAPTLTALARASGPMLLFALLEEGEKRYSKNPWLKILESSFKTGLNELQEWVLNHGAKYDTWIDAI